MPPVLRADLSQKTLFFYPGTLALRLGGSDLEFSKTSETEMEDPSRGKWSECSFLRDCSVATDECGRLVGVRQDSRLQFFDWIATVEPECKRRPQRSWKCEPSLACLDRRCSIRWLSSEPGVDCGAEPSP